MKKSRIIENYPCKIFSKESNVLFYPPKSYNKTAAIPVISSYSNMRPIYYHAFLSINRKKKPIRTYLSEIYFFEN